MPYAPHRAKQANSRMAALRGRNLRDPNDLPDKQHHLL